MSAVLETNDSASGFSPTRPERRMTVAARAPRIEPSNAATSQVLTELLLARWMAPLAPSPQRMPPPPRLVEIDPAYPPQSRAMLDATFARRPIDWGQVNAYAIQVLLNQR